MGDFSLASKKKFGSKMTGAVDSPTSTHLCENWHFCACAPLVQTAIYSKFVLVTEYWAWESS